jgi:SAM-dependent methyltransferase
MTSVDPYAMTDRLDDTLLQVVITRLEARGKHPVFAKMLHDYLDIMRIDTARMVLDMGCGTGVAARGIAGRRGFSGRVTGIDLSAHLAATAARLADESAAGNPAETGTMMTSFTVGAATITRIEETYEPDFDATGFFPDWRPHGS